MKKSISIIVFLVSLLFTYRASARQADPCLNGRHNASCFNALIHPENCKADFKEFFDPNFNTPVFDFEDDKTSQHKIKVADLIDQVFAIGDIQEFRICKYSTHSFKRSSQEIFKRNCTLRL